MGTGGPLKDRECAGDHDKGSVMADQTTVLVAEDDTASREIMGRLLQRSGYRVLAARDGAEAAELMTGEVRVAVLDWMMPGMDGLALCRRIKSTPETACTYAIMVTAKAEKADLVAALAAGADDYMSKPVDHDELLARVRAAERIAEREVSLTSAYREISGRACRDSLTGLHNRRHFDDALSEAVDGARVTEGALSLLMLDVDHFKQVNDVYGHHVGDEVLRKIADAVAGQVRGRLDTVARYGGDELAVIAPGTLVVGASILAERILRHVAQVRVKAADHLISVTVSIGTAALTAQILGADDPVTALIEEADMRLYQAKHAGRNRVAA